MATTTTRVSLRTGAGAGPNGPQRGRSRLLAALAAGTVAAVALAVAAIALRDDNDVVTETPSDTTLPAQPVEPLVAIPIPDGYEIRSVLQTETLGGGPDYTITYSQKEPDTSLDFSAFTVQTTDDTGGTLWEPRETLAGNGPSVRGHETVQEVEAGTTSIFWQEADGVVVTVSYASDAPDGAFAAFVAALRPASAAEWQTIVDDFAENATTTDPLVAMPVPDGYTASSGDQQMTEDGGTSYGVSYDWPTTKEGPTFSGFTVRTTTDPHGTEKAMIEASAGEMEVRGHPAMSDGATNTSYVSWVEKDGVVVTVSFTATDMPDGAFEDFVETLRPATADEWQGLLDQP